MVAQNAIEPGRLATRAIRLETELGSRWIGGDRDRLATEDKTEKRGGDSHAG